MTTDPKSIALQYIESCGRGAFDAVAPLLAEDVQFVGPGNAVTGAGAYLAVLKRLGPVWTASEVRKVFADGAEVCVIYDLATNTPAGKVPIVEWLHVEGGRIRSVNLFFDRVAFKPAAEELARRAGR